MSNSGINKGFDSSVIEEYRKRITAGGKNFVLDAEDERTDEYVHFQFVGQYEDKEVVYDAVMYTLRLQHESEIFEIAEQRAAEQFPEYKKIGYDDEEADRNEPSNPQEEEIGMFIAEVIMELEEEEAVKVKEHVDMDSHTEFGVALDIGLHLEKISDQDVSKFVDDFNADALRLDESLYSFQTQDEGEDE